MCKNKRMRFYASFYRYGLIVLFCLVSIGLLSMRSVLPVWVAVPRFEVPVSVVVAWPSLLIESVVPL